MCQIEYIHFFGHFLLAIQNFSSLCVKCLQRSAAKTARGLEHVTRMEKMTRMCLSRLRIKKGETNLIPVLNRVVIIETETVQK